MWKDRQTERERDENEGDERREREKTYFPLSDNSLLATRDLPRLVESLLRLPAAIVHHIARADRAHRGLHAFSHIIAYRLLLSSYFYLFFSQRKFHAGNITSAYHRAHVHARLRIRIARKTIVSDSSTIPLIRDDNCRFIYI